MLRLGLYALTLILPGMAVAQVTGTPDCQRDWQASEQGLREVRQREQPLGAAINRGDVAGACRMLRQNEAAMVRSREVTARCVTGHDRGEGIAMLDANLSELRAVLAARCR